MADLLAELKSRLQITWADSITDQVLMQHIIRSKKYFNELCENDFLFEIDSTECELLFERCRYVWNNALDEFEVNYKKELQRLIMDTAIAQYKAGESSGE
ncbi:hypothetical protein P9436_11205 [Lysinibacillus capsici]|uniref:hypothetical protein n=1 Tax=Lysinibacillus capsici TaxID=2115968 RepID=UPI002E2132AA|nr:hypothetical protein [Lysinibacillus capsici]